MSTQASGMENSIEKRTHRAVEEAMTVVPHGGGSSMFDVSSSSGKMYTVSLHDPLGCNCPDWIHRGDDLGDSGCKHIRRVRLAVGIDPIPVELLDEVDHCLQNNRKKFGAEPGTISIEDMDAQTAETMTDGGREKALKANSLACGLVDPTRPAGISTSSVPSVSSFRTASFGSGTGRRPGRKDAASNGRDESMTR